jgi:hypothetical protein
MARKTPTAKSPAATALTTRSNERAVNAFTDIRDWTLNNPDGISRDFSYDILKRQFRGVEHSTVKYVRAKLRHPTGSLDHAVLHRDVAANQVLLPRGAADMMACPHRLWSEMDNAFMGTDQHLLAGPTIWFPEPVVQHWAIRQVVAFAQAKIADFYGAAVHVIAHAPERIAHGSDFHIHLLCTARIVKGSGFGEFVRPLVKTGCQLALKAEWEAWWSKSTANT